MARKLSEIIYLTTPKKNWDEKWLKKNSNLFQIKIGQLGTTKFIKNEKKQSCSKLDKMGRRLVRNHY